MKDENAISQITINRLTVYFRELRQLQQDGTEVISSEKLGSRIGIAPGQIRKDLAQFGYFGKKGIGYIIRDLIWNISEILGLHQPKNIAVIGIGHLGWALSTNRHYFSRAFNLKAVFAFDRAKTGTTVNGVEISNIESLEKVIKERDIHIGVITTPSHIAQEIADRLVAAGIVGIWNFAPTKLTVPDSVALVNEDISIGLARLSYYLLEAKCDIEDPSAATGNVVG